MLFSRAALRPSSCYLHLLKSWDCRYAPPHLADILSFGQSAPSSLFSNKETEEVFEENGKKKFQNL
jgi:hypothetical protein